MKNQLRYVATVAVLASAFSTSIFSIGGDRAAAKALSDSTQTSQTETLSQSQSETLLARMRGRASWYGYRFHGRTTASGERFNAGAYTAAHRSLPFGTRVRVTNLRNGQSVVVRINDRGPYVGGRVIDLSKAAARAIGMVYSGTAPVRMEVIRR
jgi:rare lipoprotein A